MARITMDVDLLPGWKSPVTSGIRTAMAGGAVALARTMPL